MYEFTPGYGNPPFIWVDNDPFTATLVFDGTANTYRKMVWKDKKTGNRYFLFFKDFLTVMKQKGVEPGAEITGTWMFKKQGTAYGIKFVG